MRLVVVALALGSAALAACTPADYSESPVLGAYFESKVGTSAKGVTDVSVCQYDQKKVWVTSVLFEDGMLLSYEVLVDAQTPILKLLRQSTKVQREDARDRSGYLDEDCLGDDRSGRNYQLSGTYRFEVSNGKLAHSYVRTYTALTYPFDAKVMNLLDQGAVAVKQASADRLTLIPPEQTWGLKP